jgi:predicted DNA-binding transcriptional regulator YafY
MVLQIKGRATAQELAERLEVSERTIYRDIEALSVAGVPVYAERGPGGGCVLAEGYRTNLTGLSEDEVRSLFTPGATAILTDLGANKTLEAALLKLLATLPSSHRANVERTRQRLYMDTVAWYHSNEPVPFLRDVQDAIWQDHRILLSYRKGNGELVERDVDPLALVAKAGIWYMVAVSRGDLRVFRVSRIRDVRPIHELCQRPANFDLEQFWAQWSLEFEDKVKMPVYTLTLRVSPVLVSILPQLRGEGIHRVIEAAPPPDDEGWITIPLEFGSFEHARGYVLGLGPMVEVIEPQELREGVKQFAAGIVEFYRERDG